ncbi:MAG: RtcB family protein, partial [Nanoarchaeota archaeon]|nr:RtcB family protein [Nanoarchaeota archaeon]
MEIKKLSKNIYEISKGRIFASEKLMQAIKQDKTLKQLENISKLPGLVGNAMAMPDAHQGFGFPIGGVAAFDLEKGIISPGGVGYDINCGVRILTTNLTR